VRARSKILKGFDVFEQPRLAADDDVAVALVLRREGEAFFDEAGGNLVELRAVFADFGKNVFLGVRNRFACEFGVEIVAGGHERRDGKFAVHFKDTVFDEAILKDEDGEDFTRRELDELHLFHRAAHFWCDDEAGAGREAREERSCLFKDFCDRTVLRGTGGFDAAAVVLCEIAELHQAVDVKTDALFGRQSSGGCVRRIEQAGLLEIRHGVADAGGGQAEPCDLGNRVRADGLACGEVGIDDKAEDGPRTVVQLRDHLGNIVIFLIVVILRESGGSIVLLL
jgi:hypothetical protein